MKARVSNFPLFVLLGLSFSGIVLAATVFITNEDVKTLRSELTSKVATILEFQMATQRKKANSVSIIASNLIWPEGEQGEREMQKKALELLQASGQIVQNYQRIEPQAEDIGKQSILRVEFVGPFSGMLEFLNQAEKMSPPLATRNLQVRVMPNSEQREDETMISTRMTLWGYLGDVEND